MPTCSQNHVFYHSLRSRLLPSYSTSLTIFFMYKIFAQLIFSLRHPPATFPTTQLLSPAPSPLPLQHQSCSRQGWVPQLKPILRTALRRPPRQALHQLHLRTPHSALPSSSSPSSSPTAPQPTGPSPLSLTSTPAARSTPQSPASPPSASSLSTQRSSTYKHSFSVSSEDGSCGRC